MVLRSGSLAGRVARQRGLGCILCMSAFSGPSSSAWCSFVCLQQYVQWALCSVACVCVTFGCLWPGGTRGERERERRRKRKIGGRTSAGAGWKRRGVCSHWDVESEPQAVCARTRALFNPPPCLSGSSLWACRADKSGPSLEDNNGHHSFAAVSVAYLLPPFFVAQGSVRRQLCASAPYTLSL